MNSLLWICSIPLLLLLTVTCNNKLFDYVKNPEKSSCGIKTKLLIIVNSAAVGGKPHRQAIRETWGDMRQTGSLPYRVLFLLGIPAESIMQEDIDNESKEHNDIIQVSVLDSYHNVTSKHIAALAWFSDNCPYASYLVKADQDIFVDPWRLFDELNERFSSPPHDLLICGFLATQNKPIRDRDSKYYLSEEEYSEDDFPVFCSGSSVIYSSDVVEKILEEIRSLRRNKDITLRLDDVYVTGILRRRAGLAALPLEGGIWMNWETLKARFVKEPNAGIHITFVIDLKPAQQHQLWRKLIKYRKDGRG